MENMDIIDAPAYWARSTPNSLAIRDEEGEISWADLMDRAMIGAAELTNQGILPGSRVGLLMKNSRQFCVSALAVLAAGGILVPINYRLHRREILEQLEDAGAKLLIHYDTHQHHDADVA